MELDFDLYSLKSGKDLSERASEIEAFISRFGSSASQWKSEVFRKLHKLTGVKNELEAGFYWSIVHWFQDPSKSLFTMTQTVENNSKIAVAYTVTDECFVCITDQRSGINLIHNVVYNCGLSNIKQGSSNDMFN